MSHATTTSGTDYSGCRHESIQETPSGWLCMVCGALVPLNQLPSIVRPA